MLRTLEHANHKRTLQRRLSLAKYVPYLFTRGIQHAPYDTSVVSVADLTRLRRGINTALLQLADPISRELRVALRAGRGAIASTVVVVVAAAACEDGELHDQGQTSGYFHER